MRRHQGRWPPAVHTDAHSLAPSNAHGSQGQNLHIGPDCSSLSLKPARRHLLTAHCHDIVQRCVLAQCERFHRGLLFLLGFRSVPQLRESNHCAERVLRVMKGRSLNAHASGFARSPRPTFEAIEKTHYTRRSVHLNFHPYPRVYQQDYRRSTQDLSSGSPLKTSASSSHDPRE